MEAIFIGMTFDMINIMMCHIHLYKELVEEQVKEEFTEEISQ